MMVKMKNLIALLFACTFSLYAAGKSKIKVACVGNSVTYGYLLPEREQNAYPFQLQCMLGNGYDVRNFGHSGATLLYKGHRPYVKLPEFRAAMDFAADWVVIHLGLNDTDPRNWPNYASEFIPDYRALIDSFRQANPKAKIWICRMTPITHAHSRFLSGTRDWYDQIQTCIEQIARTADVGLIDLQTPLYKRVELFPDALHPNVEGAEILARTVYGALTGDYGGLQLPPTFSDGMVLQRNRALSLEGIADAGEKVTVGLNGQRVSAYAGADGRWMVKLSPMKEGGPYELRVETKKIRKTFQDVWIGEVWLCSGQSNMLFTVKEAVTAKVDLAMAESLPTIHLFNMKNRWPTNAVEWDSSVLDTVNKLGYYQMDGWERCSASSVVDFSSIAFHFGRTLSDSLPGIHIGLICNAVGGASTEAWTDRFTLEHAYPAILKDWLRNDHIQGWARGRAALNIKKSKNPLQRHPYEPCYLFEAGILPLNHYPIKGVIWYQGESNAHNIELHERLFPLMVAGWRRYWKEELPFYFVQLSSLNRPSWPLFRDSQRRLASQISNVSMVVSSDKGDSLDVHPRRKREIGERLAFSALYKEYGHEGCVPSGPLFREAHRRGAGVAVYFDWANGLQTADGGKVCGMEIAGTDGIYKPAIVEIQDGYLQVSSPEVKEPWGIRYAWQPFTRANLVNGRGLPASTFRMEGVR